MDEADRLADRVAIIDHGKLLLLDTPGNLKKSIGEGDILEINLDTETTPDITGITKSAREQWRNFWILVLTVTMAPFFVYVYYIMLTGVSMIAFSLILAAVTKTANEVLVVGNFPLFLFMFFTGAAFPMKGKALFTLFGYPFSLQGLISPTHAIDALKKALIMKMSLTDILPELIALTVITVIYFAVGVWAFNRRHMKIVNI